MSMQTLSTALRRVTSVLLSLVLVGSVLAFALIALGPHLFGYRTSTMLTGSMEPGISPGDVVVTAPRAVEDVKVGDVISYHIPVEDHRVETHRIVEVQHTKDGGVAVRTRGDANDGNDPWLAVLEGDTVHEMQFSVPYIGQAIRTMRSPFAQKYLFWGALGLLLMVGFSMIWSRRETQDDYDAALDTIADELDPAYAVSFARDWLELLPERVHKVTEGVDSRDHDAAMEAILGLKTSGETVGALVLAEIAADLQQAVVQDDWDSADALVEELSEAIEGTQRDLVGHLAER